MNLDNEITKEVFEKFAPVAKMPDRNTSVFSRMGDFLSTAYARVCNEIVGQAFVETVENNALAKTMIIRITCIRAFIQAARSLDLVLTSTGFGIVSTESTAPASAQRVNSLISDLRVQAMTAEDELVCHMIHVEGWGLTAQAEECIPTLFYRPRMMKELCSMPVSEELSRGLLHVPLSEEGWQTAKARAKYADTLLRSEISGEYMDELLQKLRTDTLEDQDRELCQMCLRFMGRYISDYERTGGQPDGQLLRKIAEKLEENADQYPTYKASSIYEGKHAQGYENKPEDAAFFFM